MENLNAEQVKRDLEKWAKNFDGKVLDFVTLGNALALINSQEQRIKELTEEKNEVFEKGAENLTRLEEAYLKLEAVNLKLTEENAEVKANWQKLKDSYDNNDKEWREAYADSQSKWEKAYEKLELTLEGVMHFVDKWLDGAELEYDEVNRAITMREKTLQIVEKLTEENERLREENAQIIKEAVFSPMERANNTLAVRADTVRKMHSMLCEGRVSNDNVVIVANQIAKEMLEGG